MYLNIIPQYKHSCLRSNKLYKFKAFKFPLMVRTKEYSECFDIRPLTGLGDSLCRTMRSVFQQYKCGSYPSGSVNFYQIENVYYN